MDGSAFDATRIVAPFPSDAVAPSRLQRIADLLGCPVDAFDSDAPAAGRLAEANELLRLWLAIPESGARARVLELARSHARG